MLIQEIVIHVLLVRNNTLINIPSLEENTKEENELNCDDEKKECNAKIIGNLK